MLQCSLFSALAFACSPAASKPPRAPEAAEPAPAAAEPTAEAKEAHPVALPASPAAVPPPNARCDSFVRASSAGAPAAECSTAALAHALAASGSEQDAALAALEPCSNWPQGVLRALRAELAPAECADVVVASALEGASAQGGQRREMADTLLALGLAGRLRRLAVDPPPPPSVHDKATLQAYFKDTLFPWISRQADAIRDLSRAGAALRGYAQGVVAIEAGMADMRFVEIARGVPIPTEMEGDADLRNAYYAALDEALEPRKERGRDAALVGLGQLAQVGVLRAPRLSAARELLSRVYGAHRLDALDVLLLPALPALPSGATEDKTALELLARTPTYYAQFVVPEAGAATDEVAAQRLRASLEQGVSHAVQQELATRPGDQSALLLARAKLELGRTYFRAEDFAEAARLLQGRAGDEAQFLHALATALVAGPRNAAELIRKGPRFADALGNLEALDAVAGSKNRWAGAAAFNAAYLRELVAPPGDAAYWRTLEKRYQDAARHLTGTERKEATTRANAARDTARSIGGR